MAHQTDINEKMRSILIDWLFEVHQKFKLMPETLYLTVNLVRACERAVPRRRRASPIVLYCHAQPPRSAAAICRRRTQLPRPPPSRALRRRRAPPPRARVALPRAHPSTSLLPLPARAHPPYPHLRRSTASWSASS
jgi:hypothetical protein